MPSLGRSTPEIKYIILNNTRVIKWIRLGIRKGKQQLKETNGIPSDHN
jgi:hypothetical protein